MKRHLRCLLQTLSPVHVGCDEVYEPMGFVLDEENGQLIAFDPFSFLSQLNEKDKMKFSQICSKGTISSILEIYKFLKGRKTEGRPIKVCQGFVENYKKTLSIPEQDTRKIQQELNRFTIERTSFNPGDQKPYISGSGVKGAIRTAYLNKMAQRKKVQTPRGERAGRDLEKVLLDGGAFETDPFRMIKVSDFHPVGSVATKIVFAVNEKKISSQYEARGPYQILEVIEPGALFEGGITVEEPHQQAGIKSPISLELLLESISLFFRKEMGRENEELKRVGIPGTDIPENDNFVLIRFGRHSGAESLTIEGHRNIKIMLEKGQKRYENHATTFWLASEVAKPKIKKNLLPFGWAALGELTEELEKKIEKMKKI
ncbi:MAG: type III-A CRISPR-associated RAMP protein Csm5 [Pseudomonadota bacterium]